MAKTERKKIGVIGIDSGTLWIGDPCYFIASDEIDTSDWGDFISKLKGNFMQWNYKHGHAGLGMTIATSGDGEFPVYAELDSSNRVHSITIDFLI